MKETMFELNKKYESCPVTVTEHEIDGKKYIVHRHFIGNKDIDKIITETAFNKAINEMLTVNAA